MAVKGSDKLRRIMESHPEYLEKKYRNMLKKAVSEAYHNTGTVNRIMYAYDSGIAEKLAQKKGSAAEQLELMNWMKRLQEDTQSREDFARESIELWADVWNVKLPPVITHEPGVTPGRPDVEKPGREQDVTDRGKDGIGTGQDGAPASGGGSGDGSGSGAKGEGQSGGNASGEDHGHGGGPDAKDEGQSGGHASGEDHRQGGSPDAKDGTGAGGSVPEGDPDAKAGGQTGEPASGEDHGHGGDSGVGTGDGSGAAPGKGTDEDSGHGKKETNRRKRKHDNRGQAKDRKALHDEDEEKDRKKGCGYLFTIIFVLAAVIIAALLLGVKYNLLPESMQESFCEVFGDDIHVSDEGYTLKTADGRYLIYEIHANRGPFNNAVVTATETSTGETVELELITENGIYYGEVTEGTWRVTADGGDLGSESIVVNVTDQDILYELYKEF